MLIDFTSKISTLSELTDTDIVAPINGQALLYDEAIGKWINGDVSSGGEAITIDSTPTEYSTNAVSSGGVYSYLLSKQDTLINGTSIKTINGQDILGNGNIEITVSGNYISVDCGAMPNATTKTVAIPNYSASNRYWIDLSNSYTYDTETGNSRPMAYNSSSTVLHIARITGSNIEIISNYNATAFDTTKVVLKYEVI